MAAKIQVLLSQLRHYMLFEHLMNYARTIPSQHPAFQGYLSTILPHHRRHVYIASCTLMGGPY